MNFVIYSLIVIVILYGGNVSSKELPFKKCSMNSEGLNDCVRNAIDIILKKSKEPFPEMRLPRLDPLEIPLITLGSTGGAVAVEQNFTGILFHGYSTIQLTDVGFDLKDLKLRIQGIIPFFEQLGQYKGEGKIFAIPVYGQGAANITFSNAKLTNEFKLEKYEKNNNSHFKVIDTKVTLEPERGYYYYENLFNGNKLLGDNINKVINENWKEVYEELEPQYEAALSAIHSKIVNAVFTKFPISKLFEEK